MVKEERELKYLPTYIQIYFYTGEKASKPVTLQAHNP